MWLPRDPNCFICTGDTADSICDFHFREMRERAITRNISLIQALKELREQVAAEDSRIAC